jgi:hypothetical protein
MVMSEPNTAPNSNFRVIAIIAAFNEGDVIYHVIRDLIENGVMVYLIDNCSTDDTVTEASKWLGKGLLHIERFPDDAGFPERASREYVWRELLRRKEQLSSLLDADWFIHADADEFRESIWPNMRLADGIRLVNQLGYNAIDFAVLNFRPADDQFVPGDDVRRFLTSYEPPNPYDVLQIKAWKKSDQVPDLASSGGHEARFECRKVFPFQFPLRHYPIRGTRHGRQKVFLERLPRFIAEERETGWHVQYDQFRCDASVFIWPASNLIPYDPVRVRSEIVTRTHERLQRAVPSAQGRATADSGVETAAALSLETICSQLHDKAAFVQC